MSLVTADEAKALLRWHGVHHTHGLRPDDDCEACELDAEQGETIEERARDLAHTVVAQAAEIATLRAAYTQDLDGLRAEVRRADDERAAWRERVEAAERETLRLRSLLPAVAFIRCPTCGTDRDAELDDDAVYVMRRHPRRTTRDGYDEMMWCDGGVVSEVKR